MSKEIALIGYGRFGRLAAAHLRKDFQVCVVEPRKSVQLARGMRRVSLEEAASKPVPSFESGRSLSMSAR
ncbi:MAG: hypothetical protein HY033_06260 [Ignavibacteriae bacterium]|nr:hypothetical protein [Ignavibacteriota bacterium]